MLCTARNMLPMHDPLSINSDGIVAVYGSMLLPCSVPSGLCIDNIRAVVLERRPNVVHVIHSSSPQPQCVARSATTLELN